jgi:hypothetical protein
MGRNKLNAAGVPTKDLPMAADPMLSLALRRFLPIRDDQGYARLARLVPRVPGFLQDDKDGTSHAWELIRWFDVSGDKDVA